MNHRNRCFVYLRSSILYMSYTPTTTHTLCRVQTIATCNVRYTRMPLCSPQKPTAGGSTRTRLRALSVMLAVPSEQWIRVSFSVRLHYMLQSSEPGLIRGEGWLKIIVKSIKSCGIFHKTDIRPQHEGMSEKKKRNL